MVSFMFYSFETYFLLISSEIIYNIFFIIFLRNLVGALSELNLINQTESASCNIL